MIIERGWLKRWAVVVAIVGSSRLMAAGPPSLTVSGSKFVDPEGRTVILRGVSSMGMAMVYGNSNPGTYMPMTPAQSTWIARFKPTPPETSGTRPPSG